MFPSDDSPDPRSWAHDVHDVVVTPIPGSSVRRFRDLLVLDDDLVVATDAIGGIGPKPADTVYADAVTVAHFALRVPLLEVICAGAHPIAVVDDLCVERTPTGEPMITEISRLAAEAGVPAEAVTGSTENNAATRATGVGITVLGRMPRGHTVQAGSQPGDIVLCAGLPLSAPRDHVFIGHPAQVPIASVRAALACGLVHDAVPVGSRGLNWEVPQLTAGLGLRPRWLDDSPVARTDSGGPASCVLLSCAHDSVEPLRSVIGPAVPLHLVAQLTPAAKGQ